MESSKILSATLADIVFDGRNKAYGAYELRVTYATRMTKALISTGIIISTLILFTMVSKNKKQQEVKREKDNGGVVLKPYQVPPEIPPQPETPRPATSAPTRTVPFSEPVIKPDPVVTNPIATIDDLANASPGTTFIDGPPNTGIVTNNPGPATPAAQPVTQPVADDPVRNAQVQSKFRGDWVKFLTRNLNPDVPLNNGAPPGRYTIIIEFVVDREGNVSSITPLTHVGFGMEEEAVRVIRKATKWEPAMQNGMAVKAFHKQPITFEVVGEE